MHATDPDNGRPAIAVGQILGTATGDAVDMGGELATTLKAENGQKVLRHDEHQKLTGRSEPALMLHRRDNPRLDRICGGLLPVATGRRREHHPPRWGQDSLGQKLVDHPFRMALAQAQRRLCERPLPRAIGALELHHAVEADGHVGCRRQCADKLALPQWLRTVDQPQVAKHSARRSAAERRCARPSRTDRWPAREDAIRRYGSQAPQASARPRAEPRAAGSTPAEPGRRHLCGRYTRPTSVGGLPCPQAVRGVAANRSTRS